MNIVPYAIQYSPSLGYKSWKANGVLAFVFLSHETFPPNKFFLKEGKLDLKGLIPKWITAAAAAAAKSLQSCQTLCDPIDISPPGSPTPGILQARTLECVAVAFSNA